MKPGVVARIRMRPESEGGRRINFTEVYRPHFVVAGHTTWLGVCGSDPEKSVSPGEEVDAEFALIYHPRIDYSILKIGTAFEMVEGPCVVATGIILELRCAAIV
jgi:translation elongation factor EF-Tu-like GTPase